ncbi:MAG: type I restriction enzyme HsdR N-terminal domain-containing protein [Firmicutes bacterium]|nr:type I restriction enzyme HsdR N-terminal domain-containing protein [Bacillota bacterium]
MDYNEVWEEICFHVNKCKNKNCREQEYQIAFEKIFHALGWKESKYELVPQHKMSVGSLQHGYYADIVIKNGDTVNYVVELKRPNSISNENHLEQLRSYMLLLDTDFGILIGDTMQVYYGRKKPIKVCNIEFDKNSSNGIEVVSLLAKENFCLEALKDFCFKKLALIQEKEKIQDEINNFCTDYGNNFVCDIIRQELSKSYSQETIDEILKGIKISITKNVPHVPLVYDQREQRTTTDVRYGKFAGQNTKDYTQYTLNGKSVGGKSPLVLAVINEFVRNQRPSNINELKLAFPDVLLISAKQWGLVRPLDEAQNIHLTRGARHNIRNPIKLPSGEQIAVCTQWGTGNIDKFIEHAKRLGYAITEKR